MIYDLKMNHIYCSSISWILLYLYPGWTCRPFCWTEVEFPFRFMKFFRLIDPKRTASFWGRWTMMEVASRDGTPQMTQPLNRGIVCHVTGHLRSRGVVRSRQIWEDIRGKAVMCVRCGGRRGATWWVMAGEVGARWWRMAMLLDKIY